MLKVTALSKRYKKQLAVDQISFEITPGQIVGLLGPNGAGKSTTIKCICGLIRPSSGEVTLFGKSHTNIESKKIMAYVPEMPELYDLLTVWEHLVFISKAYRLSKWEDLAIDYLNRYELIDKQHELCQELSKGMRQKLSLIMALIIEPKVILFDEPMIGLDPKAIRETKAIMQELADKGCIVLVSTHLLDTIESLCNTVMVMKSGKIIANGSPEELIASWGEVGDNHSLEDYFLEVTRDV